MSKYPIKPILVSFEDDKKIDVLEIDVKNVPRYVPWDIFGPESGKFFFEIGLLGVG